MRPADRICSLLLHAQHPIAGSEIAGICGLWSGRFYLTMYRLERAGIVTSEWEFQRADFPRRRMYRLKDTRS